MTSLLVREDELAVGEHIEHAQTAHADFGLNAELLFDEFFQAPGPSAMLRSYEAAFDLDIHAADISLLRAAVS